MITLNPLKQEVVEDPKAQPDKFPQKSGITQRLLDQLNPLHQSSSSLSSEPEVAQKSQPIITKNNSVYKNILDSMLPH